MYYIVRVKIPIVQDILVRPGDEPSVLKQALRKAVTGISFDAATIAWTCVASDGTTESLAEWEGMPE